MEQKNCTKCGQQFEVTGEDLKFYEKISPVFNGQNYLVPAPTLCSDCRWQRRLSFRNERNFYKRKCDLCQKDLISIYSPDKPYKIYCPECYWSDKWNPMDYGQDFDFSRPFSEQFNELFTKTPQLSLIRIQCENCDYVHDASDLKNCYLVFDGDGSRDCMYGQTFAQLSDCTDFFQLFSSELCYECTNCIKLYNCRFCFSSQNCSDSSFLRDCIGCQNCFGCVNLVQQKYHIFNKQVSIEEYENFIRNFNNGSYSALIKMKEKVYDFWKTLPVKYMHGIKNEEVSGDFIYSSKNAQKCYDCISLQDCKYCQDVNGGAKDSQDFNIWGLETELVYECSCIGTGAQRLISGYYVGFRASEILYSTFCMKNVMSLFGCASLHHKKYCILNKQYTQEEYEAIVPKIIEHMKKTGEWGEFFSASISAFGYNETEANDYFPLTKEPALKKGFNWSDYNSPAPVVERVVTKEFMLQLPDNIKEIPDEIINWAFTCQKSGKLFRIVKKELDYYRKNNLPLPRLHPDERHKERIALRNPRILYDRNCMKCGAEIKTTYSPDRPEIIYCEVCYLKEVY